jgi:hypothetical protein
LLPPNGVPARELSDTLQTWPWLETARTLRERFREDKLSPHGPA